MTQDFFIQDHFTGSKKAELFFKWVKRNCLLENNHGQIYLKNFDLEFPDFWSQMAIDITASKYFKKNKKEKSLKQLVNRVSKELEQQAIKQSI